MNIFSNFFRSLRQRGLLPKPSDIEHLPVNAILIEATAEGNQKKRKTVDETANDETAEVRIHFVCFFSYHYSSNPNIIFTNPTKVFDVWYNFIIGNPSGKYEVFNYTLEPFV